LENVNKTDQADLIKRLTILEYAIRQSMTVREDQDEPVERPHKEEAERYGISAAEEMTKGELLNAVQTLVRATQARAATGLPEK
jgi:hypothetical protein